ncbi:hypothetical protein ACFVT1_40290 [Streptomyces sp. NPDC057963]|uniref:hypothetical protein n=1 Tax=Streptomyces sp. NPDC057963 TaxID=3346290 RepID=UPI0036F046E9
MKKTRHMTRAAATAIAVTVSVLAVPATASADNGPHPEVGTHCTSWESAYGPGGYTFTDFRTCVVVSDREGRSSVVIETDRNTYWWSGAWYNTSTGYSASVSADVNMGANSVQGGPSVTQSVTWEQKSRSSRVGRGIGIIKCGARQLDVSYYQTGAYYGSDKAIDVKRSYDDFVIPCSWN